MQATTLHDLSLAEAAAAVRSGEVAPIELTDVMLVRIERLDPTLNSYITITADAARTAARAAGDAFRRGDVLGPLHGVPIALKDLFDTAGVRTTAGAGLLHDRVPVRDATVTARLQAAGAILLGKLNMHEFAFGVTTANPHFGSCRNPWDVSRIPGGSSGGSGAAVAAALCYGALGSDTGGSIRIPASLCGVTGLKPSYGRVSRAGVLPLSWTLDHVGPMTRTVTDAAIMLNVIAGHDSADPASAGIAVMDWTANLEADIRGLRIGLPRAYFWEGCEPGVLAALEEVAAVLRAEGAEVRDVEIPDLALAGLAFPPIISAEAAAFHQRWLRQHPGAYGDDVRERLETGALYPATQYINAQRLRRIVTEGFLTTLTSVDVLLTPATPVTAPALADTVVATPNPLTRCTFPINLTGLPALVVPCGQDGAGLPVGAQFIGRPFAEDTVLRVGRAYERVTEHHLRRPGVY